MRLLAYSALLFASLRLWLEASRSAGILVALLLDYLEVPTRLLQLAPWRRGEGRAWLLAPLCALVLLIGEASGSSRGLAHPGGLAHAQPEGADGSGLGTGGLGSAGGSHGGHHYDAAHHGDAQFDHERHGVSAVALSAQLVARKVAMTPALWGIIAMLLAVAASALRRRLGRVLAMELRGAGKWEAGAGGKRLFAAALPIAAVIATCASLYGRTVGAAELAGATFETALWPGFSLGVGFLAVAHAVDTVVHERAGANVRHSVLTAVGLVATVASVALLELLAAAPPAEEGPAPPSQFTLPVIGAAALLGYGVWAAERSAEVSRDADGVLPSSSARDAARARGLGRRRPRRHLARGPDDRARVHDLDHGQRRLAQHLLLSHGQLCLYVCRDWGRDVDQLARAHLGRVPHAL
jgi:hypothetical protein